MCRGPSGPGSASGIRPDQQLAEEIDCPPSPNHPECPMVLRGVGLADPIEAPPGVLRPSVSLALQTKQEAGN